MALAKMKLMNIIGPITATDDVVYLLGSSGVFQPDDTQEFFSDKDDLIPIVAVNPYQQSLNSLSDIMSRAKIKPAIVNSDEFTDKDDDELFAFVKDTEEELGQLLDNKDKLNEDITLCKQRIENTKHFIGLDIDVKKLSECEFVRTKFGKIPKDSYIKLQSYDENPCVEFFPMTKDSQYYWGIYVTPIEEADKVDRIFSRLFFEPCEIDGITGTPKEYLEEQNAVLNQLNEQLKALDEEIKTVSDSKKNDILKVYSAICKRHAYLSIKNHACSYHDSFVLVGWIPSEYEGKLKQELLKIDNVEVAITDAKDELKHSPPVKLKNRFFSKPFEYYTEMYGMPNYREIDPSGFIALTYTLLFGIMFADVGQGFMLLIAAIVMYKYKKMPLGRLLIPCSISSIVFGAIFGSVFGFEELLNPVYKAIFGLSEKPVDVMESNTTMILIFSAVGIGIILLMIAMVLNIISSIKRRDFGNALFGVNGLAGLIFYASLIIGLGGSILLNLNLMTTPYILCLIVLPIVLVFFREPLSKLLRGEKKLFEEGIGSFFVDNFFELFEVLLSYVTNTMSFLRVGAFVLVHAGMMQVVFVLGGMSGVGSIGYYITIVIGNVVVMALEALLVGIQVLRLEYYEMFNRFFIGDGRKYEPVNIDNM